MVRWVHRCIAAFALVVASNTVVAQRVVRGAVRDSGTAAPVAGVVLSVIDSSGKTTSLTI